MWPQSKIFPNAYIDNSESQYLCYTAHVRHSLRSQTLHWYWNPALTHKLKIHLIHSKPEKCCFWGPTHIVIWSRKRRTHLSFATDFHGFDPLYNFDAKLQLVHFDYLRSWGWVSVTVSLLHSMSTWTCSRAAIGCPPEFAILYTTPHCPFLLIVLQNPNSTHVSLPPPIRSRLTCLLYPKRRCFRLHRLQ